MTSAGPTILAVDDVPQNTRLLEAVLTAHGYEVVTASSGAEAIERAKADAPDLVLLDIEMPGMTGYEVCRRLREDNATAFLPVVMLTSHQTEVRVDAIEAGPTTSSRSPSTSTSCLPACARCCGSSSTTTRSSRRPPSSPTGTGCSRRGCSSRSTSSRR